jgi:hypothetical protein
METTAVANKARLHPLEIVAPLLIFATLVAFALPNYLTFAPGATLDQASSHVGQLVVAARKASVDKGRAVIRINTAQRQLTLQSGPSGSAVEIEKYTLPGGLSFGYSAPVTPYPGLKLPNGTDLAATDDGVTFDNDEIVFEEGLLTGFPGLIYLHNSQGQTHAIYIRISGDFDVKSWQGAAWGPTRL